MSAHPRRLLSWRSRPCRTPSSGSRSGMVTLARPATITDVLSVLSGSHRLASRWCGSAKGIRREGSGTGTGIRVSVRMTSLLFHLGEGRHRQPRAVYKYWAPCLAVTCPFAFCLKSTARGSGRSLLDTSYSALIGGSGYICMLRLLFPYTAQCLVLSGTCHASVLGWLFEEFHAFLREGVHSAPEVDSRVALP